MPGLPRRSTLIRPLRDFLATEAAGGILVVSAAVVAVVWANSPWSRSYDSLWHTDLGLNIGRHGFHLDLRHWVNDALMTVFFFVVGLEIKRETVEGELKDRRKAIVPVVAAFGGMVVPAVIFSIITIGTPGARGWGIPMATDIALAIGVLSIIGARVSAGARLFLLALAIVDDIGAIIVIAVFYGTGGARWWLVVAVLNVVAVVLLRRTSVRSFAPYVAFGAVLWFALHEAGVHATIAGVVMGLLAPTKPVLRNDLIDVDELTDVSDAQHALATVRLALSSVSVVEWLEHRLHGWTSFLIVPIFAVANAGIDLSRSSLADSLGSRTTWAVAIGLVIGKPVGILTATYLLVRLGAGALPDQTTWRDLSIAATVGGIGFTVSLFVTELAFTNPLADEAKIGVVIASLLAGVIGVALARGRTPTSTSAG
jgi:Na+:H+ antiporter, NhaA family